MHFGVKGKDNGEFSFPNDRLKKLQELLTMLADGTAHDPRADCYSIAYWMRDHRLLGGNFQLQTWKREKFKDQRSLASGDLIITALEYIHGQMPKLGRGLTPTERRTLMDCEQKIDPVYRGRTFVVPMHAALHIGGGVMFSFYGSTLDAVFSSFKQMTRFYGGNYFEKISF